MKMLKDTRRTFYIPITVLAKTLKHAVGSAYLCMRAIDEIEDHETFSNDVIATLLRKTADLLEKPFDKEAYLEVIEPYKEELPEVSVRLGDWINVRSEEHTSELQSRGHLVCR